MLEDFSWERFLWQKEDTIPSILLLVVRNFLVLRFQVKTEELWPCNLWWCLVLLVRESCSLVWADFCFIAFTVLYLKHCSGSAFICSIVITTQTASNMLCLLSYGIVLISDLFSLTDIVFLVQLWEILFFCVHLTEFSYITVINRRYLFITWCSL